MSEKKLKYRSVIKTVSLCFLLVLAGTSAVKAQELPYIDTSFAANEAEGNDITLKTYFKLVPANWSGRSWVVRNKDNVRIGWGTWDDVYRRATIFNLRDEYRGFLQATIGKHNEKDEMGNILPHHYREYLWYWKDDLYRFVSVRTLGGRPPKTPKLPYGELGGDLQNFGQFPFAGNVPVRTGPPQQPIEPIKGPMGIDISVTYRLPTILSK